MRTSRPTSGKAGLFRERLDAIVNPGAPLVPLQCYRKAAREAGLSDGEIATFVAEAMSKDYDHLLQTAMRWFEVI
jgi:hypothetical protein